MFPKFLLKKLYMKGSLKKEENGFSFIIKNNLASGTIIEVFSLKYDDEEATFNDVSIIIRDESRTADTISEDNPIMLKKGLDTKFLVSKSISDGSHKIELHFKTKEVGTMKFDFTDEIS
ncbi:MAG: hypothetical protein ACW981_03280 [Candidatus Hodarchaeales archaeon]